MEFTHHYESPLGGITLAGDSAELTGLWFDGQKFFGAGLDPGHVPGGSPVFEQAEAWLDRYFSGRDPGPTPRLRMKGTAFRRSVWTILCSIPYGSTTTYGAVAAQLARDRGLRHLSAQAVGGAVGHNPISLMIPCHRVLAADGSLTGYAAGLARKQALLDLEAAGY